MAERRELTFASLDEVMPDVERLLAGHVTVGRWTLGQILNHLATAIRLTTDTPANSAEPTREQDVFRRRFFHRGRFADGIEVPLPVMLPQPGLDRRAEADSLRHAIARYTSFDGPFPAHPRLGPMTGEEWTRFHCIHCAHHLGLAVPD
ncbi:MAG: DUF1569 domain-containing protein [Isosphaeraceae bacterium]